MIKSTSLTNKIWKQKDETKKYDETKTLSENFLLLQNILPTRA